MIQTRYGTARSLLIFRLMKNGWVLFLALLLASCAPDSDVPHDEECDHGSRAFHDKLPDFNPRLNLFIIGGGTKSDEMMSFLVDSCLRDEASTIAILPWASSEPDTSAWIASTQFERLTDMGVISFVTPPDSLSEQEVMQIQNADLIYMSGGDQSRFIEAVDRNPSVVKAIKWASVNGGCVAGTSAGAALMSKIMITGDQVRQPEYESTYRQLSTDNAVYSLGLGLIDNAIIDQHFIVRSRHNRLLTALHDRPGNIGIGVDESTALWINTGLATVVGERQVILYYPAEETKSLNDKIGLRGVTLDVLLPGEQIFLP